MGLKQITAPAVEPITLADIKSRVNMDDDITEKDADIEQLLIPAARAQAESRTGRAMITQTLQLTLDCFPRAAIRLLKPQLQSVDWIKYLDADGVIQTLATSDYLVVNDELYGYVVPAYGKSWPVARHQVNAISIQYVAGYGSAPEQVPADLRLWMMMAVATWLNNPEALITGITVSELPRDFCQALLDSHIVNWGV
ncbi:hypothetical protein LG204_10235 [Methylovorus menthalis]|uniref:head-tail connector protein n=1 Tax=Methylovorus menthalis TaxID=1002227 RepID=UPI001E64EC0B|nr:hypothetical protein [Methylovorus menthalis]MCB4811692.1 hypothetical protein [Methylovorus menthalis]